MTKPKIAYTVDEAIDLLIDDDSDRYNYSKLIFLLAEYDEKIEVDQILKFVESLDNGINKIDLFSDALHFAAKYPDKAPIVIERIIQVIKTIHDKLSIVEKENFKQTDIFAKTIILLANDNDIDSENLKSFIEEIFQDDYYRNHKINVLVKSICESYLSSNKIKKLVQSITKKDDKIKVLAESILNSKTTTRAQLIISTITDEEIKESVFHQLIRTNENGELNLENIKQIIDGINNQNDKIVVFSMVLAATANYNPDKIGDILILIPKDIDEEVKSSALYFAAKNYDANGIETILSLIPQEKQGSIITRAIKDNLEAQTPQFLGRIMALITNSDSKISIWSKIIYEVTDQESQINQQQINNIVKEINNPEISIKIFAKAIYEVAKKNRQEAQNQIRKIINSIPEDVDKNDIFSYAIYLSTKNDPDISSHQIKNIVESIPAYNSNKTSIFSNALYLSVKESRTSKDYEYRIANLFEAFNSIFNDDLVQRNEQRLLFANALYKVAYEAIQDDSNSETSKRIIGTILENFNEKEDKLYIFGRALCLAFRNHHSNPELLGKVMERIIDRIPGQYLEDDNFDENFIGRIEALAYATFYSASDDIRNDKTEKEIINNIMYMVRIADKIMDGKLPETQGGYALGEHTLNYLNLICRDDNPTNREFGEVKGTIAEFVRLSIKEIEDMKQINNRPKPQVSPKINTVEPIVGNQNDNQNENLR